MLDDDEPPDWAYWAVVIALIQVTLDLITAVSG